ncbi:ribonucleotide reductase assembly protein NrdI [[Bacillus] sp. KCTC 13219]|nr:ribonucleotide reductase assembly protein NrdI [[Bacillus] sp. KCTC 13219]
MIVFASRTGNVRFIINQLQLPNIEMTKGLKLSEPYLLFTYTDGLGTVPQIVEEFLQENAAFCKGVIASGNSNFGHNVFCGSADKINATYQIPIVRKLELRGFAHDYEAIREYYQTVIEGGEKI